MQRTNQCYAKPGKYDHNAVKILQGTKILYNAGVFGGSYKTVFKFCKWLNYDAWRHFCDWSTGCRNSYPGIARLIHWFGKSTAGYAIGGGRCFHCNDERGDPINISQYDGDNPKSLLVSNVETWTEATMDGTDYRFSCITKCPCCGYKSQFSDGSL